MGVTKRSGGRGWKSASSGGGSLSVIFPAHQIKRALTCDERLDVASQRAWTTSTPWTDSKSSPERVSRSAAALRLGRLAGLPRACHWPIGRNMDFALKSDSELLSVEERP